MLLCVYHDKSIAICNFSIKDHAFCKLFSQQLIGFLCLSVTEIIVQRFTDILDFVWYINLSPPISSRIYKPSERDIL